MIHRLSVMKKNFMKIALTTSKIRIITKRSGFNNWPLYLFFVEFELTFDNGFRYAFKLALNKNGVP